MQEPAVSLPVVPQLNEDPITHEHGAHPVATGVGAAGGSAAAAVIGLAVGGPIGGVIGALVGALAGGLGGSAVGEQLQPTIEVPATSSVAAVPSSEPTSTNLVSTSVEGDEPVVAWHDVIPSGLPSYEEIALRAYSLYEAEGQPEGQDVRHWLEAEYSLQAETLS